MKPRRTVLLAAVFVVVAALALLVSRPGEHFILLTNAVAAPVSGDDSTVQVYLTIRNDGAPDKLLSVHSPHGAASLHAPRAEGLPIPANSAPMLAADGAHITIWDLRDPPRPGQLVPLSLEFENAGKVSVKAIVDDAPDTGRTHIPDHFGVIDICEPAEGEPIPRIDLSVSQDIDGGWVVDIGTEGFTFNTDLASGPHVPGTGHAHLYIDGLKIQRLYGNQVTLGALPRGDHVIRVTLNSNDHRTYSVDGKPVFAEAVIQVN